MARTILFLQGAGESAHDGWDAKLVASLGDALGAGYAIRYPRMPDEADPKYAAWRAALRDAFDTLEEGAVLVGHSVGGAVLIHVLAEQLPKRAPGAVVLLAAPFIGEGGWSGGDIRPRYDFAERLPASLPVLLYHGTADETVPFAHLALYAAAIPQARVRPIEGSGHQFGNDLRVVAEDIQSLPERGSGRN